MNLNWRAVSLLGTTVGFLVGWGLTSITDQKHQAAEFNEYQAQWSDVAHNLKNAQMIAEIQQQTIAVLQARTQACEAKFSVGTIVYEPSPAASLPLLHGAVSLSLAPGEATAPAWFIPAQVAVYTNIPGARYQWQDMKTGELRGEFAALPSSAMGASR